MVEGDVYSSDHIELAAKARVVGNVYYNLIEMVMGSEVNGSLLHRSPEELKPKKLEKPTVVSSERDSVVVEAAAKASS